MSDTGIGGVAPLGQLEPVQIVPFDFEGLAVRVVTLDDEPRFVLADICRVLEISNARDAASRLDDDEKDGVGITDAIGREQLTTVVSESGLYSLILTSRKEAAKRFKKWVTSEVLPTIRKTGGYLMAALDETPEALALRAMTVLQATVERQKAKLAEALPKAEALDRLAEVEGSHCITDAAKLVQVAPKALFTFMQRHGWIYRRTGADHWCAYQSRIITGDLIHKVTTVLRADGTEKTTEQVRVTPSGLTKLAKLMGSAARLATVDGEAA
ncbi:phage repressor protein/antirepressor Ant [Roseomonas nepalensis]|uniref:Phage repressor protein/antirepressor Ant n=1 Tax=Muricoccus nepalensis TaxID=1854500 RepID=A0A502FUK1_9PROT|nr:phage antirepressor [Roseomonas nepalensis]TPG53297.1 phage repressor protein/antirepressor Ant [Roseomonas nepalensis]